MAILSTSYRPKGFVSTLVEGMDYATWLSRHAFLTSNPAKSVVLPRALSEDVSMTDSGESSSSDDSSGSEDAPRSRPIKQAHRPSAMASSRRWFPSFAFFSRQAAAPVSSAAGSSRKRRNSDAEDELPSKRAFRS
ncbi:hypothetical protein GQ53DRAFT_745131 [Thozetella sp. PMI_491]|nr:hypothetical protein GQ53DRAFT_745131 [Thozetella sp. PMI_491]